MISIVEVTCDAAVKMGLKRVGLFGTRSQWMPRFTVKCFRAGASKQIRPESDERAFIHDKYMNELVNGINLPKTREQLLSIANNMIHRDGIDGLILGGTELPLMHRQRAQRNSTFEHDNDPRRTNHSRTSFVANKNKPLDVWAYAITLESPAPQVQLPNRQPEIRAPPHDFSKTRPYGASAVQTHATLPRNKDPKTAAFRLRARPRSAKTSDPTFSCVSSTLSDKVQMVPARRKITSCFVAGVLSNSSYIPSSGSENRPRQQGTSTELPAPANSSVS